MFTLEMVFLGASIQTKEGKESARLKFHDSKTNEVFEFYTGDANTVKVAREMTMYGLYSVMLRMATYKGDINVRFLDAQPVKK